MLHYLEILSLRDYHCHKCFVIKLNVCCWICICFTQTSLSLLRWTPWTAILVGRLFYLWNGATTRKTFLKGYASQIWDINCVFSRVTVSSSLRPSGFQGWCRATFPRRAGEVSHLRWTQEEPVRILAHHRPPVRHLCHQQQSIVGSRGTNPK